MSPFEKRSKDDAPDDVDELPDGDVVGDEELGLVEDRELPLGLAALDDDRDLVRVHLPDGLHVLDALGCGTKGHFYGILSPFVNWRTSKTSLKFAAQIAAKSGP